MSHLLIIIVKRLELYMDLALYKINILLYILLEREKQHTPHFPESRSNAWGASDVADNFSACLCYLFLGDTRAVLKQACPSERILSHVCS